MTPTHSQLQITVDQETIVALQEVKELLSHTIPDGNLVDVLKYMISLTSQTLKKRKGRTEPQRSDAESTTNSVIQGGTDEKKNSVQSRSIPIEIKRKVFARAGGYCEYESADGKRCQSRHQLEFDHVVPLSQGGHHHEDSLRIFCRMHNQYRTKETHGFWYTP